MFGKKTREANREYQRASLQYLMNIQYEINLLRTEIAGPSTPEVPEVSEEQIVTN